MVVKRLEHVEGTLQVTAALSLMRGGAMGIWSGANYVFCFISLQQQVCLHVATQTRGCMLTSDYSHASWCLIACYVIHSGLSL